MSDPVHDYLAEIGRKGGVAGRGSAKARTSEQARMAALVRWGNRKRKARAKRSPNKQEGHMKKARDIYNVHAECDGLGLVGDGNDAWLVDADGLDQELPDGEGDEAVAAADAWCVRWSVDDPAAEARLRRWAFDGDGDAR